MKDPHDAVTRELLSSERQDLRIKFCKIRNVKSPIRANPTDAGIDFFVPENFEARTLEPGESVLIPSGIRANVPAGWMMLMENKSGVGHKMRLSRLACVIDHGYQGEIHINLVNCGTEAQVLTPGMKIIQGILLPIGGHVPEEVADPWDGEATARGAGGFGSSGA